MVKGEEFKQFLKEQKFVLVTWKELAKRLSEAEQQEGPNTQR
jgi:hypothetical protein